MAYEQPADTISAGALSAENAAEFLKPIRKAVAGNPGEGDTSEEQEEQSEETEEGDDTPAEEDSEVEVDGDSEQADDEEASEDETDEEPEETEEEPAKGVHTVKVDGKEVKVTLDELKKGYSFTAHNTRRAQEISAKELALSEQASQVAETAKAYAEHLAEVKDALAAITPKEPDWDKLQKENPAKFAEQWAAWDKHKKGLAALDEEHSKAVKAVQAEEQKVLTAHLVRENEMLETKLPAWKDQKVRAKELAGMKEFAKSQGFTEDELNSVIDHRTVLLLRAAYKHSVAQKARPEAERKINEVRALTPGSIASAPGRATVAQKAIERLEKTGSVDDAVAALQAQRAVGGRPRRR